MTFQATWKEIMAKKTTTTFKVTLEYSGPPKDFDKLMKIRRCTTNVNHAEVVSNNTVKIKPEPYVSDDEKLTRAFVKQALEAAKLKFVAGADDVTPGTYSLKYGAAPDHAGHWNQRWGGGYSVVLYGTKVSLKLVGLDRKDLFQILTWDFENPQYQEKEAWATSYHLGPGFDLVEANEDFEFSIAQPDALDTLIKLFKKYGHKNKTLLHVDRLETK